LAGAGYHAITVARRESDERGEAIRANVERGTGGFHFRAFDLGEIDATPAFVKGLRDEFGAIYGLGEARPNYDQDSSRRGGSRRRAGAP
jgi:3-oxoacyl-[acyl-carrier protein] reductase